MQETHLSIIWKILSEYISNKDLEPAAHHLVSELIDAGADEDELWSICKGNSILRRIVTDQIGEAREDSEEDEEM